MLIVLLLEETFLSCNTVAKLLLSIDPCPCSNHTRLSLKLSLNLLLDDSIILSEEAQFQ